MPETREAAPAPGLAALREMRRRRLIAEGVVAVLRLPGPALTLSVAKALAAGGVRAVEVTTTVPGFDAQIELLRRELGDAVLIGAGTLLTAEHDRAAAAAGAEFLVSPVVRPALVAVGAATGAPVFLGALTPTECHAAWSAGADFVKLFPADALGPAYVRALRAPMPFLPLAPTGGVDLGNLAEYRRAGCLLVGAGGSLVSATSAAAGDWAGIAAKAKAFRDAWDAA